MTRWVCGIVVTAVMAAAVGCAGSSASAPTKSGTLPNASEMFDKKEMPKGAKPGGKADPG